MSEISEKAHQGVRSIVARGNVIRNLVSDVDPAEIGHIKPSDHKVTVTTWLTIEVEVEVTAAGKSDETFLFNNDEDYWRGTCTIGGHSSPEANRTDFPNKVKAHPKFDPAARGNSPGVNVSTKVRFNKGRWTDDASLVHPVRIDPR
ncbi:MAG: hypothetical protein JST59_03715 [Actinobacteria bacterium]|nr:hypothetical protein [Actinomycetota bacterium]